MNSVSSSVVTDRVKRQRTSDLVNLDTYTTDNHLIVSKAHGDKMYIGCAYDATPLVGGGAEFATVIRSVFKAAPDDSVVQVTLICAPDYNAPNIITQGKTHGGPVVQELIKRQATLLKGGIKSGWQPDVPLLNVRTLLLTLAIPVKGTDAKTLIEASSVQREFLNGIRGSGFGDARLLSAGDLIGYYRQCADIYTPISPVVLDELLELKYQAFTPEHEIDFRDPRVGVFGGDTYCTTVTAKAFPEEVYQGLMNLAVGAPFNGPSTKDGGGQRILTPFIFNTTVRIGNQRKEMDRVKNAVKSRINQQTLPFKLGNEDPVAALADLQFLEAACATDSDKFVYVSSTAFLFGRSAAEAREAASGLKNTLNKLDFDARECRNDSLVRWAQCLPLNFSPAIANKLDSEAIMPSASATCLLPVYTDNTGNVKATPDSIYTGTPYITRRGSVHYFDSFRTNSNANGLIVAASGSGKSYNGQYAMTFDLAQGTNVFALDNGKSMKKFCRSVGGEFNDFSANEAETPSLNPFTGLTDKEFDEQQEGITALFLLMSYESELAPGGARIAMSEAVRAAFNQKQNKAELSTVISCLEIIYENLDNSANMTEVQSAARNLVPRLKAFLESPSRGRFFRGKGTINPTKQFTVFELSGLDGDDHLRRCVLFFVLNTLMTRIKDIPGRKKIYIDEAFDLLKDPGIAAAMEGIYLKGRKSMVSVWIIMQSLLKLVTIPVGSVIMKQSAWKLVMAQNSDEVAELFNQNLLPSFANDEYFKKLIANVTTIKGAFSETLFIGEGYYEVARLYVDKFTSALFNSESEERDAVFGLMDRGLNAIDAVNSVLDDKAQRNKTFIAGVLDALYRDGLSKTEILAAVAEAE